MAVYHCALYRRLSTQLARDAAATLSSPSTAPPPPIPYFITMDIQSLVLIMTKHDASLVQRKYAQPSWEM